jgi:hypothetical protein
MRRFGAELVDAGGHAFVHTPTQTRGDDEQATDIERCARLPHQQDTGGPDQRGSRDEAATEVLAEHERRDRERGHLTGEHRCGGRGGAEEDGGQQASDHAALRHALSVPSRDGDSSFIARTG